MKVCQAISGVITNDDRGLTAPFWMKRLFSCVMRACLSACVSVRLSVCAFIPEQNDQSARLLTQAEVSLCLGKPLIRRESTK